MLRRDGCLLGASRGTWKAATALDTYKGYHAFSRERENDIG